MNEEQFIRRDRMRFTKNTLSSTLDILAIVFDVFYFINIYKSDVGHNVGNFYYQIRIGASIIYNLVFMLAAFLSSEGVKNYKKEYCYILLVIGVIQIVRIFILPAQAAAAEITIGGTVYKVMERAQHIRVVLYLLVSAACCLAGGVIGIKRCNELSAHLASLQESKA